MVVLADDIVGMAALSPHERDPILLIHPQAVTPKPIALQSLQPIPSGQPEIL
jgi:hypothetical protein